MRFPYIVDHPRIILERQHSPVTCWVASGLMLRNWKNRVSMSYQNYADALPPGLYGFYTIEENVYTPDGNMNDALFNLAMHNIDQQWNNLYTNDGPVQRIFRIADTTHNYMADWDAQLISRRTRDYLSQTSGIGLPYEHAVEFFRGAPNDFRPLGENRLYSARQWLAMLMHYGPLLVAVSRISNTTHRRYGHFVIVDGFYCTGGEPTDNEGSQLYLQDPKEGTIRGQLFPHFQADCRESLATVGTMNYIWHANKTGVRALTVDQCVAALEQRLAREAHRTAPVARH